MLFLTGVSLRLGSCTSRPFPPPYIVQDSIVNPFKNPPAPGSICKARYLHSNKVAGIETRRRFRKDRNGDDSNGALSSVGNLVTVETLSLYKSTLGGGRLKGFTKVYS